MIHFVILLICILSVEIIVRLNFFSFFGLIIKVTTKATHIISQSSISEHWKQKVIPIYAFRIIKYCIHMFFIIFLIFTFFIIANYFFRNFLDFSLSLLGIVETIVFAFGYICLRKSFIK